MTSTQPTATAPLVQALRGLALELERDLGVRADEEPVAVRLRREYDEARGRERMAAGYAEWLAGRVAMTALGEPTCFVHAPNLTILSE